MKFEKIAALDIALKSGDPLTTEQLGFHLGVDCKHAPRIAKASGLEPENRRYPWRRIWRYIHGTEGAQLARHLDDLKEQFPGSVILSGIEDLEAALRAPLIDFATMAARRGCKPDTLSKGLRQGRVTLPFPKIDLGPRTRLFRPLEVQLWCQEEIRLDLPKLPNWVTVPEPCTETAASDDDEGLVSVDPTKKAIFGGFAGDNRNHPT